MIVFNMRGRPIEPETAEICGMLLEGLSHVMLMLRSIEVGDRDAAAGERESAFVAVRECVQRFGELAGHASDSQLVIPGTRNARSLIDQLGRYGHEVPGSDRQLVAISRQEVGLFAERLQSAADVSPRSGLALVRDLQRLLDVGATVTSLADLTAAEQEGSGHA